MINEHSSIQQIQKEVKHDIPHVVHALIKSYGGKRAYESDLQQMAERVKRMPEGSAMMGNVESYTSGKTGNNWIAYSCVANVGFSTVSMGHFKFLWWNTEDGSIAAMQFSVTSSIYGRSTIIYSGHFFRRYAQREGLGDVDLQLVTDFMRKNNAGVFQADDKPVSPGRHRADIILSSGIGRGYTEGFDADKPDTPFITHIQTYLPTSMLNPTQRKLTAEARAIQASKSRPSDTFVNYVMADDMVGLIRYFGDLFMSRGLSFDRGCMFAAMISSIVIDMAAITPIEGERTESARRALMLRLYHRCQQPVYDFVESHPRKGCEFSILEEVTVAYIIDRNLDIRAMLAQALGREHGNENLEKFIDKEAQRIKMQCQKLMSEGKIPRY